jgi:hypothetical protein
MPLPDRILLPGLALAAAAVGAAPGNAADGPAAALVAEYCLDCHATGVEKGGLDLERLLDFAPASHPEAWEKVARQLRARQMPPAGEERPGLEAYDAAAAALESALDVEAAARPDPGRTETFRRLTRSEYRNAVRDLLAVEIDPADLLPKDEEGHGFDNVTAGELSPTLLERYVAAARLVSRMAVGTAPPAPAGRTVRVRPDRTQEEHVEGLPLGTRGGTVVRHHFPQDGEYHVRVHLARDRNELVEGLREPHQLEILLDDEVAGTFEVLPPPGGEDFTKVDAHLGTRLRVTAGPHDLGVTFAASPPPIEETLRQPYASHFNFHRHPRLTPAVYQVSITGPFDPAGPGHTPSRQRLFTSRPAAGASAAGEEACAEQVLATLLRRAWRRPVDAGDVARLMPFFRAGRDEAGFEAGVEVALSAVLISPEFLIRVERDPPGLAPGTAYPLGGSELATRLSFFLWSSLPDDDLLDAAERGDLATPDGLAAQARRMLADPKSRSLAETFAGQWLHLRNLEAATPDGRLFPDFDDNLRQAMRTETEMLFGCVVREDRSALDLLRAEFTFLDGRLAEHYGIPHVYGPRFRKVALEPGARRGGILRHASVLTVTSYATRTSPVLRGNWILENLLGTPAPPPPPDVPALDDVAVPADAPVRERLAAHRADRACAACHAVIDPVGFALENYDAVGRWRESEDGRPVDAEGGMPDGSTFTVHRGRGAGTGAPPAAGGLRPHPD